MSFALFPAKARPKPGGKEDPYFAKFPKDIVLCEEKIGGDKNILDKPPYTLRKITI